MQEIWRKKSESNLGKFPAVPWRDLSLKCLRRPETANFRNVDFDVLGLGRLSMKKIKNTSVSGS